MPGQYIFVENPLSEQPAKLEKQKIPPMSEYLRREGLALSLPFDRRDVDARYPDKKVETIVFPLKSAHFSVASVDQDKRVLEIGQVSVLNWLARLIMAGFRVHNSASEAFSAQSEAAGEATIAQLNRYLTSVGAGTVWMQGLGAYLTKSPRGKNAEFDRDTVALLVARNLGYGNEATAFTGMVADRLMESCDGWGSQSENPALAPVRAQALCDALGEPSFADALIGLIDRPINDALVGYGVPKTSLSYRRPDEPTDTLVARINADDGVLEVGLSTSAYRLGQPDDSQSVMLSDGPTYNGLSWLLNPSKGLGMWCEADARLIANHFGCPVELVQRLKEDARAIARDYSGGFGRLHELRSQIGGGLSSFATRYFERLTELHDATARLADLFDNLPFPASWLESGADRAFWGTGFTAADLLSHWEEVSALQGNLQQSASRLIGQAESAPSPDDLKTLEHGMDRVRQLFGRIRLVFNNIRMWHQDTEAARAKGKLRVADKSLVNLTKLDVPDPLVEAIGFKGLKTAESTDKPDQTDDDTQRTDAPESESGVQPIQLRQLVRRSAQTDALITRLTERRGQLEQAVAYSAQLIDELSGKASLADMMLAAFQEQDRRHYVNRGESVDDRFLCIQSRRHLLDEWFRFWSSLSRPALDYAQAELVALDLGYSDDPQNQDKNEPGWRKKAHQFMQEKKGLLWRSLFAKTRRKPFGLNSERLLALDMVALIDRMTRWLDDQHRNAGYPTVEVDYHTLFAKRLEMVVRVTEKSLSVDHPVLTGWPLPATFRPGEMSELERMKNLQGLTLRRIVGRLAVSIRDAASFLNRERHLDQASFKPVSPLESLGYLCKTTDAQGEQRLWCPPERLWVSDSPAGALLREIMDNREAVPVASLFDALRPMIAQATPESLLAIRGLLKELPHTWGLVTDLTGLQGGDDWPLSATIMVGKVALSSAPRNGRVYPIVLTPSRANLLDECLLGQRTHMPGSLVFKYAYDRDQGYEPCPLAVEVHVPTSKVAPEAPDKANSPFFDRLVGIDLGERGIGFSVREVSSRGYPLVARGFVPVPAVKKLIQATQTFRQRHQKAMSVRMSHVDFSEMRQSVAGNVISVIKYLMHHYQALPVLEMNLNNLNGADKQLSHVYGAVSDAFISRGVPTVDKARANTWRGWKIEHPYLDRVVTDPKTRSTRVEPFKLFPGTGVRAAHTSNECSGCGINPVQLLREHGGNRITLDDQGCVELGGKTLQFYTPASVGPVVRGEGVAPTPLANRVMLTSELLSYLKQTLLRIRPASEQSKDTSKSRYWCANKDCQHHHPDHLLHADMNAADNIVMRRCKTLVFKEGIER